MRKIFLSILIALFAVLCFTKAPEVQAQSAYSCNTPGVEFKFDDDSLAVVVAVDAAKMNPDGEYYVIVGPTGMAGVTGGLSGSVQMFELPDQPTNGFYVGGVELPIAPKGHANYSAVDNYTAVVANSNGACGPMESLSLRRSLDITTCTAFGVANQNCIKNFQINRTDETNYQSNVDPYSMIEDAQQKVGKVQVPPYSLCQQIPIANSGTGESGVAARAKKQESARNACCKCATGNQNAVFDPVIGNCSFPGSDAFDPKTMTSPNLYTAVGCIPTSPENIIRSVVRIGLGIAGGVALLMILAGAFMYTTSQGEPKRTGEARDMITSAVMGLLFIIFSVVILRFIGVSILQIPGFG